MNTYDSPYINNSDELEIGTDIDIAIADINETEEGTDEQIELNEEDLRELERMSEDFIPEIFKIFTINNGFGKNIAVRTTDFSEKGLRIAVDGIHGLKPEQIILLNTLTGNLQLSGEIKYCLKTNTEAETSYLGIYLQKTHSINEYIRLINEKIKNP